MTNKKPLLAYFGHHKSASMWIYSIVRDISRDIGIKHIDFTNPKLFDYDLKYFINQNKIEFFSYTNANFKYIKDLDNFKGFHVIRDPRDVIVSGYFSHLYSHGTENWSELIEHRKQLEKLSKDKGLLLEMEFSRQFLDDMYGWNYSQPNVLEIKMEELVGNPYKKFIEIFQFLEILDKSTLEGSEVILNDAIQSLKIIINRLHRSKKIYMPFRIPLEKVPGEILLKYVCARDFKRLAKGRNSGEENVKSHYRKGVSGDWKNHFTEEHIKFFQDNYNDVVLKLGYESTPEWGNKIITEKKYLAA